MFTTGHQANLGALGTILAPGDTVIADSGDHASILDGCILSRAKLRAVPPQPAGPARAARSSGPANDGGGILVVVDGVFSMEGDVAPLPEIADLCARYGARLMVDEAHALGVLGARGAGTCELLGVEDRVDLRMATFSKSLASCGGVIAGPADVIEYLRIQSRPFMFTASAVPAAVGAALAAVRICRSDEGPPLFARVLDNARYLHDGLQRARLPGRRARPGWPTAPRSSRRSCRWWSATTGRRRSCGRRCTRPGVFVNTALHPAVPPAGALLRTSVMATHDRGDAGRGAGRSSRQVKRDFEAEHGPLPASGRKRPLARPATAITCPFLHKTPRRG